MKKQIKEIYYNGMVIKAGLGATECVGCEKYPQIVLEIVNEKTIKVVDLKSEHYDKIKNLNDNDMLPEEFINEYKDCNNTIYTLRKNNEWKEKGLSINTYYGVHLELGKISKYVDYGC